MTDRGLCCKEVEAENHEGNVLSLPATRACAIGVPIFKDYDMVMRHAFLIALTR